MARHNTIGRQGEAIARAYLEDHGYRFIEQNYNKKWGELDLVMKKDGVLHFVEVKSTELDPDQWRYPDPIEHIDDRKIRRLGRAIRSYAAENGVLLRHGTWQCDVCVVYLNEAAQTADIKYIPNIRVPG